MTIGEIMEKLEIRMERMIRLQPEKKRLYFDKLKSKFDSRAILLYGPRGVGKTTFLLSVARENDMLYISGDDPLLLQHNFAEIGEEILTNYSGIIIDEVHFLKDWSLTVKTLYDSFPNKKLWLSDSSSIILRKGIADLSRRFVTKKLPIMSLREYIYFETGKELPVISSPFEPGSLEEVSNLIREVDIMKYFREYKTHGTRPFYIEGNYPERMKNIIEKSLYYDILHLVGSVSENHIRLMKSLISYLIFSKIPTVNIESMCKEWGVGKPKLYELLNALEEIELINIVRYKGIEKPYSKGAKIFLADPTAYQIYEGEVGNFREAFIVSMLKEIGNIYASKDETKADFIFNDIKLEIGGKSKRRKSSDFVIRDDIDIPLKNMIPLWTFGMLW